MWLLYFSFGIVFTAIVIWFSNPGFESKISPSDLFDSLVTLLVGLIITRKVAESQNQAAKRLSEQMQNAQQATVNMRIEQNIIIEQFQKDLVKIDRVFEVVEQHRFKSLTNDVRNEVISTLRDLSRNLSSIHETFQDFSLPIPHAVLESARKQQHEFGKVITGGQFDKYNVEQYLDIQTRYQNLRRSIRQIVHAVNTLKV
jgi:hypothetical protein